MWNEVQWIKIPDMELRAKQILHGDLGGRFAYFRLEQELSCIKACCPAPASAI